MLVAHASDIHSGDHEFDLDRWNKLIDNLIASSARVVLITGDITENAKPEEFEPLREGLTRLAAKKPTMVVPGNHDAWWKGSLPGLGRRIKHFQAFVDSIPDLYGGAGGPHRMEVGGHLFVGLDSASGIFPWPPSLAKGKIGYQQMQALDGILDRAKMPVHVCLHHHPYFVGPGLKLVDADEFAYTIADRIGALFFGHKHEHKRGNFWFASGKTLREGRYRLVDVANLSSMTVKFVP